MTRFEFTATNMKWNAAGLHYTLHSGAGPVGRDISKRADKILIGARRQVGVDTGALKASLRVTRHNRDPRGQFVMVGSPLNYALMHHEGTKPHIITPNRSQYLVFNKGGRVIYATSVRHPGTRPNRYLTDNIYLAVG
jgi:hypothetical protein